MKTISTRLISVVLIAAAMLVFADASASDARRWSLKKKKKAETESSNYTFRLHCPNKSGLAVDSALIILDKYDFTGAGVVMQVVTADSNYQLNLKDIPVGKYYAGIYTYGLNRQYLSAVITVTGNTQNKKANFIKIEVAEAEAYVRGSVEIPVEDLSAFAYVKAPKQVKK